MGVLAVLVSSLIELESSVIELNWRALQFRALSSSFKDTSKLN